VHTPEQAAEIIGGTCKASWLKAGARAGRFPHVMIGGSYNFTDAQIREIVQLCSVPARQPTPAVPVPAAVKLPTVRPVSDVVPGTGVAHIRPRQPRQRK
jgi:hypothetical protein